MEFATELTEEEHRMSLSQVLESSDEEDDLGPAVFSQETANSSSSSNDDKEEEAPQALDDDGKDETDNEEKKQSSLLEQRAAKFAQYASTASVAGISDPSMLCWHVQKKQAYPVFIVTNKDEAINLVTVTSKNDTLIKYIGYKCKDAGRLAAVPRSSLHPYNAKPKRRGTKDVDGAPDNKWSPHHMEPYVKFLMKSFEKHVAIAEKMVLDKMLKEVLERASSAVNDEVSGDRINGTPKKKTKKKKKTAAFDFDEHDKPSKENRPQEAEEETLEKMSQETEAKDTKESKRALRKRAASARPKDSAPSAPTTKLKLRAGDYVRYHRPGRVAGPDTIQESRIIRVNPASNGDIALELDNNTFLPRDYKVVLSKRLIRGRLQEVTGDRKKLYVSEYTLDPSMNETISKEHQASKPKQVNLDMSKEVDAFWSRTNQQNDHNTGSDDDDGDDDDDDGDDAEAGDRSDAAPAKSLRNTQGKESKTAPKQSERVTSRRENGVGDSSGKVASNKDKQGTAGNQSKKRQRTEPGLESGRHKEKRRQKSCPYFQISEFPERARRNYDENRNQDVGDQEIPRKSFLDAEIKKMESKKHSRRSDTAACETSIKHLSVLKEVWSVLVTIARCQDNCSSLSMDELLKHLCIEEKLEFSMSRQWNFLTGNTKQSLSNDTLRKMTKGWEDWLSSGECKLALELARPT